MFISTENLRFFDVKAHALRGKKFFEGIVNYRKKLLPLHEYRIQKPDQFSCVLCGHDKGKLLLEWEAGYQLYHCEKCSAVSPNISPEQEKDHIDNVYATNLYMDKLEREIHAQYDYRKNTFGKERLKYCIKRLNLDPSEIKLLDVGCGAGYFLSYLTDHGVDCRGLEVTKGLAQYCQKRGLNVDATDLGDEADGTYDVIVMFDVLEHVYNPVELLKTANRKLKDNGYLILYTPNIHSLSFELMGAAENVLLPFEHVCFYDEKSFNLLAEKSEFNVHSLETYGFDIMDYLLMKEHEDNFAYTEKLHDMMRWVQAILDQQGLSNHFRLTLQKK
ncbi:class I SAM-dependent methyltransferase [Terasakiella sp. A23]|uniref:class I SAM-dependent methyltransferase n=1 Tax=Terasakiella sp. FCG-A23 TaxID=3080561 RepID=UPI0029550CAB|nr:class I SAM-dependent methyltransferase [Terasakiella sp. A23]MDV7340803.1 class I SAM-dependent methyltransferase [Terasakiella sp. A23]